MNISKGAVERLVNFALFVQKVTPRFILKNSFLSICIWGIPSFVYGLYLGHKY